MNNGVLMFSPTAGGQFSKYMPTGGYIWRGDLTEGFALPVWGAYINFGGAYFQNFMVVNS